MEQVKIYAIDFDGTLCEQAYPACGEPKMNVINMAIRLKNEGHCIILNTCRADNLLNDAVEFCAKFGLIFDYINENTDENRALYNNNARKIYADYYVDDKAMSIEDFIKLPGGDK